MGAGTPGGDPKHRGGCRWDKAVESGYLQAAFAVRVGSTQAETSNSPFQGPGDELPRQTEARAIDSGSISKEVGDPIMPEDVSP